jgi:hypothetical protein
MDDKVGLPKQKFNVHQIVRFIERLITGIVNLLYLSLPEQKRDDQRSEVAIVFTSFLVIFFVAVCVMSWPSNLKDLLRQTLSPAFVSSHKSDFKLWLDYWRIVLEIWFAVFVSGTVFTENLKAGFRKRLSTFLAGD